MRRASRSPEIRLGRAPRRGVRWWAGRVVGGMLAAIGLLALAGYLLEPRAAARSIEQYSPPGQMVDVGGHRLHLYCTGEGWPVVVIEADQGGYSLQWLAVRERAAAFTRVCVYDRAGYGWSEPGPLPRTSGRIADELHALLENGGEAPPYVLVGHGFGGQVARLYASLYPREVSGLVLVEAATAEVAAEAPREVRRAQAHEGRARWRMALVARVGAMRALAGLGLISPPPWAEALPTSLREAALAVGKDSAYYRASAAEAAAWMESQEELEAAGPLPDVPLGIVVRGRAEPLPGVGVETQLEYERLWRRAQMSLAGLTSAADVVVAEESGHDVMLDQPDFLAEVIWGVVQRARAERRAD